MAASKHAAVRLPEQLDPSIRATADRSRCHERDLNLAPSRLLHLHDRHPGRTAPRDRVGLPRVRNVRRDVRQPFDPPTRAWTSELARDAPALQPYGLTLSDLQEFGTPPREIATHMNENLAERELFSAVPEDDVRLRRMFDAAEIAPKFALELTDADELIAELARLRDLPPAAAARARREAKLICLTGIRAEAKVRFLATYWGFVAWHDERCA